MGGVSIQKGNVPTAGAPVSGSREETIEADYTETVVPQSVRRSNFRMVLVFGSMQMNFVAILVGYDARFQGLTLGELAWAVTLAALTMTVYCIGSANVGAVVGMTHAVTTRSIFGRVGSVLVSILLMIDGMAFYLFTVIFMISLVEALVGTFAAVTLVTAVLAFVMIVNNYFGFTGLQRFAQFIATPVIIVWGVYATIKALTTVSGSVLAHVPHTATPTSFFIIVGAMIGLQTYGNEPDFFRYSKAGRKSWWNIPTIAIPYAMGAFLFPIMGYLIATLSDKPDFAQSVRYFANFSAFGLSGLMLVILIINQWAIQDANLYIAINGVQNVISRIPRWRRQYTVVGLGLIAAGLTVILPSLDRTFTIVTNIGGLLLPVSATIMAMDVFVVPRLFGLRRPQYRVAAWSELAMANIPAILALLAGTAVGVCTAGLVPGIPGYGTVYIGYPPLQGWIVGAVVYLIAIAVVSKSPKVKHWLGYSALADAPALDVPREALS
jgi:purine-cytosine permease-like protein